MIPDDPVVESNTRGILTFAKSSVPDSRTTQVFINLVNNSGLDEMGFSPFGEVLSGMDVVDAIALVPRFDAGSPFSELPLRNYTFPDPAEESNFIFATVPEPRAALLGIVALATLVLARGLSSRG